MALIVGVHGIGQQLKGRNTLKAAWLPAMRDGLELARGPVLSDDQVACAFYGDLFRGKGLGEPPYTAKDVSAGFERELLEQWWREAAATDPAVPGPEDKTKLRTPDPVQRALHALSRSRFFAGLGERALIHFIKQVHRYFAEPELRDQVRERVAREVDADTRILVAHSLGTVVAYEVLCGHPDWPVRVLVTLGSPLGIPNVIFDRLCPAPAAGLGAWPGRIQRWVNVADHGDAVALVKQLRPLFGDGDGRGGSVEDLQVDNGATAHDVNPYLTAVETGHAIAAGLSR
ncbi:MAG TPA: hypothetical protein VFW50_30725 [Streptosporangiaceae bacterium]|nr:hypothetical protein [Streptosporangiaceae bacterium]